MLIYRFARVMAPFGSASLVFPFMKTYTGDQAVMEIDDWAIPTLSVEIDGRQKDYSN